MALFGIFHADIRYGNILLAPEDSPLKPRETRLWGKPYRYRLIDFHKSVRTNVIKDKVAMQQCYSVLIMLSGLEYGTIIEPWHTPY